MTLPCRRPASILGSVVRDHLDLCGQSVALPATGALSIVERNRQGRAYGTDQAERRNSRHEDGGPQLYALRATPLRLDLAGTPQALLRLRLLHQHFEGDVRAPKVLVGNLLSRLRFLTGGLGLVGAERDDSDSFSLRFGNLDVRLPQLSRENPTVFHVLRDLELGVLVGLAHRVDVELVHSTFGVTLKDGVLDRFHEVLCISRCRRTIGVSPLDLFERHLEVIREFDLRPIDPVIPLLTRRSRSLSRALPRSRNLLVRLR